MPVKPLLVLTLMAVAFAPLIEGGTTYLPVLILHLLVILMLAAWLIDGYRTGRLSLRGIPLDLTVAAFFVVALLGVLIAPYRYMAILWVQMIVFYALFFFLSREAFVDAPGGAGYAVAIVFGMGAVESIWAVVQWLHGRERLTGSFFNPNMLAGYLAPSILLAVSLLVFGNANGSTARRVRIRPSSAAQAPRICSSSEPSAPYGWPSAPQGWRRVLLISFAVIGFVVVILTGSRGGILSLCAGVLVVLWARFGRLAIVAAAAIALSVLLVPNPVRDRVFGHDPFAYSRTGIWKSGLDMMLDHPQGVGLGNFKYIFTKYNFPVNEAVIRYGKAAATAHNEYLQIGAEMGLPGLAVFLAGLVLLTGRLKRALAKGGKGGFAGLAAGLAGGITAVFVHAAVDSNLHEPGIVFLLILLVSLELTVLGGGKAFNFTLGGGVKPRVLVLSSVFMALMAVWAAMPAAAYYYSSKANSALGSRDVDSAMTDVDRALFIEPGNASYHNQRAAILFSQYLAAGAAYGRGDMLESLSELKEAIRLNPADMSYRLLISDIEYRYAVTMPESAERARYLQDALGHALKASELAPNTAEPMISQAKIYTALGETGEAVRALEALKAAEPNCLKGRLMLARAYMELGKTGLSRSEYYNIISLARRFKGMRLTEQEKEFTKVDPASLDRLKKDLGILN